MAWKYKRGEVWWIGTRANGRLISKSTGERDEAKAEKQLAALESMEDAQRAGKLNRELFEALTGAHIEAVRLFDALDTWLKETKNPNTLRNYEVLAKGLKAAMPHNPVMSDITHEQAREFMACQRRRQWETNWAFRNGSGTMAGDGNEKGPADRSTGPCRS